MCRREAGGRICAYINGTSDASVCIYVTRHAVVEEEADEPRVLFWNAGALPEPDDVASTKVQRGLVTDRSDPTQSPASCQQHPPRRKQTGGEGPPEDATTTHAS